MNDYIHIVCLDCPSPPDYGGAIDMYYKIVSLHQAGYKVILHYFHYNDRKQDGLEKYCDQIYSYKRKNQISSISLSKPYIVQSRISKELINRLNRDNYQIILEGIHCSGIIPFLNDNKRVVLRVHNDESDYYRQLSVYEKNSFKKLYYLIESILSDKYQQRLNKELPLACLSEKDATRFKNHYKFNNVQLIPCFLPWQKIEGKPGKGNFCLYHGNMGISENHAMALWLIDHVFRQIDMPFLIAGKNIPGHLYSAVTKYEHIRLVNNPSMNDLEDLIKAAHINILPSLNKTGVKLKLLHVLTEGRFCISNQNGIDGSRIIKGVYLANTSKEMIHSIQQLIGQEFTTEHIEERQYIPVLYNNRINAEKLIKVC